MYSQFTGMQKCQVVVDSVVSAKKRSEDKIQKCPWLNELIDDKQVRINDVRFHGSTALLKALRLTHLKLTEVLFSWRKTNSIKTTNQEIFNPIGFVFVILPVIFSKFWINLVRWGNLRPHRWHLCRFFVRRLPVSRCLWAEVVTHHCFGAMKRDTAAASVQHFVQYCTLQSPADQDNSVYDNSNHLVRYTCTNILIQISSQPITW